MSSGSFLSTSGPGGRAGHPVGGGGGAGNSGGGAGTGHSVGGGGRADGFVFRISTDPDFYNFMFDVSVTSPKLFGGFMKDGVHNKDELKQILECTLGFQPTGSLGARCYSLQYRNKNKEVLTLTEDWGTFIEELNTIHVSYEVSSGSDSDSSINQSFGLERTVVPGSLALKGKVVPDSLALEGTVVSDSLASEGTVVPDSFASEGTVVPDSFASHRVRTTCMSSGSYAV